MRQRQVGEVGQVELTGLRHAQDVEKERETEREKWLFNDVEGGIWDVTGETGGSPGAHFKKEQVPGLSSL